MHEVQQFSPIHKITLFPSVRNEFRDAYPEFDGMSSDDRENETDKLITDGRTMMFLMQAGEKKLKEY